MRYSIAIACSLLSTVFALPVMAAVYLQGPAEVAKGDAFVATATVDKPSSWLEFTWQNKKYRVPTEGSGTGSTASLVLAVAVDKDVDKTQILTVRASTGEQNRKSITIYGKKRPVQNLTVDKKYVNPPAHVMDRIAADRRKVNAIISQFSSKQDWALPFLRPVPGDVSSLYGLRRVFNGEPRSVHKGLDLRGAQGTPIKAVADGTVVLNDDLYFSGNAVYLDHGQGVFSAYLHLYESKVNLTQKVKRGDVIGLVGATGRVTGPHLHLTLFVQGIPVDPESLMEKRHAASSAPVKVQP